MSLAADYYEVVILVEKLMLAGLLVFIEQGTTFQAFTGASIAFGFFALQVRMWPYNGDVDNWVKAVSEAQIFFTLFISVALKTDIVGEALTPNGYGMILIGAMLAAPGIEAGVALRELWRYICRSKIARMVHTAALWKKVRVSVRDEHDADAEGGSKSPVVVPPQKLNLLARVNALNVPVEASPVRAAPLPFAMQSQLRPPENASTWNM